MPRFDATWIAKTQIAPTVYQITLETTEPLSTFIPGQYINLEIKSKQFRTYSIAGLRHNNSMTQIFLIVDILPNGLASTFFTTHTPPVIFNCVGPAGRFAVSPSYHKKVFIATGTGIAPIIAMIDELTEENFEDIEIVWGIRTAEYSYLKNYIDVDNIKSTICVSDSGTKHNEFAGRVTDHYKLHADEYKDCDFYLCGNPNMVTEMRELLAQNNVSEDHIFSEQFLLKK